MIPFLLVVFTQQLEFLVTALAHLLSNNIWSFLEKNHDRGRAATKAGTIIKAKQIRRAGNHAYTCTIGMDLGQILTDFLNERQRCKSLGGSAGMLPMGILLF